MFFKIFFLFGLECHFSFFYKKIFNLLNFIKLKNIFNNRISLFDIGSPGTLALFDNIFLKKITIFGFYLKSFLFYFSLLVRKSYFYPDMPKNYQITQQNSLYHNGFILIYNNYFFYPYYKFIKILKYHIEEDSCKIIYILNNFKISKIDFNRCNNFLLEVVSNWNLSNFYEIFIYLNNLKNIIFYLNNFVFFKKNIFRFDLNISSKYLYFDFLNFKVEIKNLDSVFILKNVIYFEIKRQIFNLFYLKFFNETRYYDFLNNLTYFIRSKNSLDYKYFVEPDKKDLYINKYFSKYISFNINTNYYLRIYYIYNFNFFFIFKFNYFEYLFFFFKKKKKFLLNFFKNFYFLFKKNKKFSIFQIFLIFKCFFLKIISYLNLKKIFFLILKKNLKKVFFLYNIILKNKLILNNKIIYFFNFLLIFNLKIIHIFFLNKKIFNFFLGYIIKNNFNFFEFLNIINLKIIYF